MRRLFLLVPVILCSLGAYAHAIEIVGPASIPAGQAIILQVVGVEEGAEIKWVCIPKPTSLAQLEGGRVVIATCPADAVCTFLAVTVGKGVIQLDEHPVTVGVVPGPTPTPVPTPTPPGPPPVPPGPGPTPLPSAELQTILAPVKQVMDASDRSKAAVFASAWRDFAVTLEATGAPKTVGAYRQTLLAFMKAAIAREGLANAFPGFGVAFNDALNKGIGNQDVPLDQAKAVNFANALVWACGGVKTSSARRAAQ